MVKVKEGEGDMKIHSFMKIIKDIKIKVKKVYFTTSVAIVLFIIIAGCVSTQPHSTLVPTEPQPTPTITPTFSPPPQEKLPNKTLRPISVIVSAQTGPVSTIPGGGISPAGPPSWIAVNVNASSTDVPVIQLSTTVLDYDRVPVVCDNFGINEKNPLMPGQNASTTCGYRSLGAPVDLFIVNSTAAVLVEGALQNGQSFRYWTNETYS